jgi:protein-serine/threonine kinase
MAKQGAISGSHASSNLIIGGILPRTILTSANAIFQRKISGQRERLESLPQVIAQRSYQSWAPAKPSSEDFAYSVFSDLNTHTFLSSTEPVRDMGTEDAWSSHVHDVQNGRCVSDECRPRCLPSYDVIDNHNILSVSHTAQSRVRSMPCRMTVQLHSELYVDFCKLTDEYSSTSRMPGKRGREIGRGATAIVTIMSRKGLPKESGYFAVKEFRGRGKHETKFDHERKVKYEFSIAVNLNHPNIVKTLRLCHDNGRWSYVMEYCPFGDLYSLIRKNYLKEHDKLCISKQLLQGVAYLHENGIAHCDIKLENILLSRKGHIKIADFGLCEIFSRVRPLLQFHNDDKLEVVEQIRKCSPPVYGSLPYIAPEVLAQKGKACLQDSILSKDITKEKVGYCDPRAADVWSFAIVCFALWHRGNPWKAATPEDANYSYFISTWEQKPELSPYMRHTLRDAPCEMFFSSLRSRSIRNLFLQMLHPLPEKRPTARHALGARGMKSVECCCVDPIEKHQSALHFDAAGKDSRFEVAKMVVQTIHNHIPPAKRR